ncbi:beta-galactosidase [uncultured Paludibaculum sp.]|uniref:beta-galactosidase n=1 Tax=uncultured Paludibaculum sp. TaxID=1765020 RepID=UPI002AAC23BB|nr:beta-galactosidase [uncultured Paludibaculum sp.]
MQRRSFLARTLSLPLLGALPSLQGAAVTPPLVLGAAWYPEQWPQSRWDEDLKLMEQAGLRMVRVGEFAWSTLEPHEGQFELDWLEKAVEMAAKRNMVTVVGTPTAAPPAWMTQKYPDTLLTLPDGRKAEHGNRAHFSFTSQRYRQFCARIASEMAKRLGRNQSVVGWQIDNEYGRTSNDDVTRAQFQAFLKEHYGTLDALNEHWTTAYWSEAYTDWSQIPLGPSGNPGLFLAWKHFVTETFRTYQHVQVEAIRAHAPSRQFITSNYMGWYDSFDHYVLAEELDLVSWDNYVGRGHLDPLKNGVIHDLTRGLKRKNFWLIETQPGFVNWSEVNNALDKGEARAMAWHAVGHGADCISYWQWRSALNGQEQYHGTLVGADGTPVPMYEEAAQLGREFAKVGTALGGTEPVSEVAMLHSYDSRWAVNFQRHNRHFDPVELMGSYYRPLRRQAQQMDVVHPMAPLDKYKLVVAPALNVLPQEMAQHLEAYVRQGGHLVLGPRSGMKDQHNSLWPMRQPGPLVDVLGARVEQWYALDEEVPVSGSWGTGTAALWAEQLKKRAADVEVVMKYGASNGWLDDQPAVVTRVVGKGRISYVAAQLDDGLMAKAAEWMLRVSAVKAALGPVPDAVEVCHRAGGGKDVFIVINHSKTAQRVVLPRAMRALLSGSAAASVVDLPARGVEVLTAG